MIPKEQKYQVSDGENSIVTFCFIDTLDAAVRLLQKGKTITIEPLPLKPQHHIETHATIG